VGGVWPVDAAYVGDAVGYAPCRVVDRVEIEHAQEGQGGHPDICKSLEGGWVEFSLLDVVSVGCHLEGPPLHLSDEVPDRRIDVTGVPPMTVDPPGEVRLHGTIQVTAGQRGPLRLDERTQVRGDFGDKRSTWGAEQQRSHHFGPGQRDLDGHAGTEGGANQVTAVDAGLGQRVEHVIDRAEQAARTSRTHRTREGPA